MDNIMIKKAGVLDIESLQQIGRETFYETFSPSNSKENMDKYLRENFTEEKIRSEVENPESLFYMAFDQNRIIGYLKLNSGDAQSENQDKASIEIERIYVKNEYHGKKIGQLLYDKALEVANEQERSAIWLGVWEENPRAIRFYEKNGFTAFDKHVFRMGDEDQTDIMMKKKLR